MELTTSSLKSQHFAKLPTTCMNPPYGFRIKDLRFISPASVGEIPVQLIIILTHVLGRHPYGVFRTRDLYRQRVIDK